ncbi:peptide MFS transporter [Microbacterium album]|uniref:Transporter YclF n=1 Tax=Microbacterium album TaxID=2053191 RepID=A0A917IDI9_9MICO|nr:oligopeptide:H+ symporter [Microbacterium album]GGH38567.1 putative transporter YclF [Microbacterium album]
MSASASSSQPSPSATGDRRFFGHPLGLFSLATTELWERFSYYGMRAILLLFLTAELAESGLGLDTALGQSLVAIYGTGVYLLTIVGGWIADRIIGGRRAVFYGGVIIAAGHVSLALPGGAFSFLGIVLVAIGTGLLKANVSAMVGELYTREDPRRQSAFSIFYLFINLGSFFSPLVVGAVRAMFGFHAGFLVAAIGMGIALIVFVAGRGTLAGAGDDIPNPIGREEIPAVLRMIGVILLAVAALAGLATLLSGGWGLGTMVDTLSYLAFVAPVAAFAIMYRSPKVTPAERKRLLAYIPLFVAAMLFWMIFEQAATTMTTFAAERTELSLFGLAIAPEMFQSINPLAIIVLSPVFAWLWLKTNDRPAVPYKFALGLGLAGVSFLILAGGAWLAADAQAPALLLVTVYVVQTLGELCLSPVGLAATTLLAPKAFRGQAMGLWFLAPAAGTAITAQVVQVTDGASDTAYFGWTGVVAIVFAAALFLLGPWVRRLIHEADRAEGVHTSGD